MGVVEINVCRWLVAFSLFHSANSFLPVFFLCFRQKFHLLGYFLLAWCLHIFFFILLSITLLSVMCKFKRNCLIKSRLGQSCLPNFTLSLTNLAYFVENSLNLWSTAFVGLLPGEWGLLHLQKLEGNRDP